MLICDKARQCIGDRECIHLEKHDRIGLLCGLVGCQYHSDSKCIEVIECYQKNMNRKY